MHNIVSLYNHLKLKILNIFKNKIISLKNKLYKSITIKFLLKFNSELEITTFRCKIASKHLICNSEESKHLDTFCIVVWCLTPLAEILHDFHRFSGFVFIMFIFQSY